VVVLDGERRAVEVGRAGATVRVGDREWPIHVARSEEGAVSFEILGELVEVRRESSPDGTGPDPISVNGELHSLTVESQAGTRPPTPTARAGPVRPAPEREEVPSDGAGYPIFPPMPGKVLEVRVQNGAKVSPGQVLIVVEAMKMRNEVTSPVAGEVMGLRVQPGANVAARDVLLRVVAP
jgi:glutaconyl-CoA/methylmalonyl-CoA decarboxylase subunit gamma